MTTPSEFSSVVSDIFMFADVTFHNISSTQPHTLHNAMFYFVVTASEFRLGIVKANSFDSVKGMHNFIYSMVLGLSTHPFIGLQGR